MRRAKTTDFKSCS